MCMSRYGKRDAKISCDVIRCGPVIIRVAHYTHTSLICIIVHAIFNKPGDRGAHTYTRIHAYLHTRGMYRVDFISIGFLDGE